MKYTPIALLVVAVAALLFTLGVGGMDARAGQPETVPELESQVENARNKIRVAERVCHMFHDAESGAPRGGADAEAIYRWSKRRMEAEIELFEMDPSHGSREGAVRRHLEWMKAWNQRVVESEASSPFGIAITEYFVAEAEAMLGESTKP